MLKCVSGEPELHSHSHPGVGTYSLSPGVSSPNWKQRSVTFFYSIYNRVCGRNRGEEFARVSVKLEDNQHQAGD